MAQARDRARRAAPDPARVPDLGRAERRAARGHGRPDRRGRQPPPPARRGRVRHPRLRRGLPGLGYPGPWGVEVLSEELRNQPDRARSSGGPTRRPSPSSTREELDVSADRMAAARPRPAGLDVHPDAAHPRVRGARQAHVRGAPRRDPRPHAPGRRRRGVDRRLDRHARAGRPVPHDLPLPRLPDRARAPTRRR